MNVDWYARARFIKRMGPYKSQLKAWQAVMSVDGTPAPEAAVWPEPKKAAKGKK